MQQTTTSDFNEISQWVSKILKSSFGNDFNLMKAMNLIGPPRIFPNYYATHEFWAQKNDSQSNNFIDLEFPEELFIEKLNIYEIFYSGTICRIKLHNKKLNIWKTIWEADSSVLKIYSSQLFSPVLKKVLFKTNQIRLEFDYNIANTYCQFDAIEMIGKKNIVEGVKNITNLGKNLKRLLDGENLYDVRFEIDGKILKAHRNILISRSDYFRTLLCENLRPDRLSKPIHLSNISLSSFKALLNYFYTDKLQDNINVETCCDLIRFSDWYEIPKLKNQIYYYCKKILNINNVFEFYNLATFKEPKLEEIQKICEKFISKNFSKLEYKLDSNV